MKFYTIASHAQSGTGSLVDHAVFKSSTPQEAQRKFDDIQKEARREALYVIPASIVAPFAGAAVASSAHAETSNLKKADSSLAPFMGQGNKDRSVVFDRKTTNTPYNNFDNLPSNRQSNSRAMFDVLNAVQNITNDQKFNINMNINMLPGDLKGLGDHVRRELSSVSPYAIQSKRATD